MNNLYETNDILKSHGPFFIDDAEKMRDFFGLSKSDFLASYSYLDEGEYEETENVIQETAEKIENYIYKSGYEHLDYTANNGFWNTVAGGAKSSERISLTSRMYALSNIKDAIGNKLYDDKRDVTFSRNHLLKSFPTVYKDYMHLLNEGLDIVKLLEANERKMSSYIVGMVDEDIDRLPDGTIINCFELAVYNNFDEALDEAQRQYQSQESTPNRDREIIVVSSSAQNDFSVVWSSVSEDTPSHRKPMYYNNMDKIHEAIYDLYVRYWYANHNTRLIDKAEQVREYIITSLSNDFNLLKDEIPYFEDTLYSVPSKAEFLNGDYLDRDFMSNLIGGHIYDYLIKHDSLLAEAQMQAENSKAKNHKDIEM